VNDLSLVASGLRFPEGPVALSDGTVVVTEVAGGCLSRVDPSTGSVTEIARCGGGPNGAAIGPDGRMYVCNNGGLNFATTNDGLMVPNGALGTNEGGSIQVVDLETGQVDELYSACGERRLRGPNDVVFDAAGGFYFTDYGRGHALMREYGGVYYALPDGSSITEIIFPLSEPNGIGLSPDGSRLYVALTPSRSIWSWDVIAPGVVGSTEQFLNPRGGTQLCGLPGHQPVDSFAVDSEGSICVGTLVSGCVTVIGQDGSIKAQLPVPEPDLLVTNVCFGGPDLTTAYVTASGTGRLYETEWWCPGAALNFAA
jgi:gluconolactonase